MADERKDDNSSVVKNHHTGNTYTIHSFRFKEPNDEWVTYVYLDHGKNAKATIELILKKNGNRIEARDNNNHMGSSYVKENESLTPQLLHEKVKHFVMVSTSGNLVEDIISDL
ncbi:MAG TPA: hypothetical protein VND99_03670 [Candidatus Acidoferrales bacterium]|nr:hypothetical protein [Candidatus Acidoferrales bacterium]